MNQVETSKSHRMGELDFVRAIPLLGLPFVHCYETFAGEFMFDGPEIRGGVLLYLCMMGPSVFMICLGMNIVFSTHSSSKELAKRGCWTLFLFMALNLLRYILPAVLPLLCGYPEEMTSALFYSLASDILAFAGLTFLFFALMKRLNVPPFYILLIALELLTLDMLLPEPELNSSFLAAFLGNFLYVDAESCFPFLSWLIYPAVGCFLATAIREMHEPGRKSHFWLRMALGSAVGLAAVCAGMCLYGLDPLLIAASPVNESITDLLNVTLDLLIAGVWFGCAYFFYTAIHSQKIRAAIDFFSRAILVFYCVQWVVIGWMEEILAAFGLRGQPVFNGISFIITAIGTFAVSLFLTVLIQRVLKNTAFTSHSQTFKRRT